MVTDYAKEGLRMKEIVIGCDNAAVELKNIIVELLEELEINYEDVGLTSSDDDTIYPLVAEKACRKIIERNATHKFSYYYTWWQMQWV